MCIFLLESQFDVGEPMQIEGKSKRKPAYKSTTKKDGACEQDAGDSYSDDNDDGGKLMEQSAGSVHKRHAANNAIGEGDKVIEEISAIDEILAQPDARTRLNGFTVTQLKAFLSSKNIHPVGRKADIIDQIIDATK